MARRNGRAPYTGSKPSLATSAATVAAEGFDAVYGARPLRRAIVRMVEDAFSGAMLEGQIKTGDSVLITAKDGKIEFEKQEGVAK